MLSRNAAFTPLTDVSTWMRSSGLEIVLLITGAILLTRSTTWLGGRVTARIDRQAGETDLVLRSEAAKHRHAAINLNIGSGVFGLWAVSGQKIRAIADPDNALPSPEPYSSVAFSPNAPILATATNSIQLWQVKGSLRKLGPPLAGTAGNILSSLAFSPDGHLLITGNSDGTIQIWDVTDLQRPRLLGPALAAIDAAPVTSLAFSHNDHTFASNSSDGSISLWDTDVSYAIDRICDSEHSLTRKEWNNYLPQVPYAPSCPG